MYESTYLDERRDSSLHVDPERWVQGPREYVLNRGAQIHLHDLDPQGEVAQTETHDLRVRMSGHLSAVCQSRKRCMSKQAITNLRIVPSLGEQVEAETALYTACTPASLSCITLRNERLDEAADLPFLIEPHLTVLSGVDDAGDVWNSDTSLRNVRRWEGYVSVRYARE